MPVGGKAIKVLMDTARGEVDVIKSFLTTPKGVFETIDEAIVVARRGAKDLITSVTGGRLMQGNLIRKFVPRR